MIEKSGDGKSAVVIPNWSSRKKNNKLLLPLLLLLLLMMMLLLICYCCCCFLCYCCCCCCYGCCCCCCCVISIKHGSLFFVSNSSLVSAVHRETDLRIQLTIKTNKTIAVRSFPICLSITWYVNANKYVGQMRRFVHESSTCRLRVRTSTKGQKHFR